MQAVSRQARVPAQNTSELCRLERVLAPTIAPNGGDSGTDAETALLERRAMLLLRSMHVLLRYSGRKILCVPEHVRALWALAAADNEYYPTYCVLAARLVTLPGHCRLQDPPIFHFDLVKTAEMLPAGSNREEARASFRARFERLFGEPPACDGDATAGVGQIFIEPAGTPADPAMMSNTKSD